MIVYKNDGSIARITFDSPGTSNRFTYQMMTDFIAALQDATDRGAVGLVIDAKGDDFTLGRDQKEKVDISRHDNLALILRANDLLRRFPGVSISLIQGGAKGFGTGVALHSSVAIAADTAVLGFDEVKHGLAPLIVVLYLPHFISPKIASELYLTGRDVPAREARELGLVNRVVPAADLETEAQKLIAEIQALNPSALRLIRTFESENAIYPSRALGLKGVKQLADWLVAGRP
jgi:enoyl-CoA hydratase/carnithine racemase